MKTFQRSRYEFPTRLKSNGKTGYLECGKDTARKSLERELGVGLTGINPVKRGGNWVFRVPAWIMAQAKQRKAA